MSGWLRWMLGVVPVVVLLVVALWAFQRQLVFLPDRSPVPSAESVVDRGEDVTLTTSDGLELGAWWIPADGDERGTVLVANGNAGNRLNRLPLAEALSGEGFDVLLFDYRGYGGNPGSPSEDGLALDVRAARAHLVDERGVVDDELVYFGESIGSGVVSGLATEHPPGALVLRSPFTDLPAVASTRLPFLPTGLLMWDRFPVEDDVAELDVPITVVLGTEDSVVPADQSRSVAAVAGAELVEIDGADHNDRVLLDGEELIAAIVELAGRAGATGTP